MVDVGQCASLKVRKCMNLCVFTVNLSACGGESSLCETLCAERLRCGLGGVLCGTLGMIFL